MWERERPCGNLTTICEQIWLYWSFFYSNRRLFVCTLLSLPFYFVLATLCDESHYNFYWNASFTLRVASQNTHGLNRTSCKCPENKKHTRSSLINKKVKKIYNLILNGVVIISQVQYKGKLIMITWNFWRVSAIWKEFSFSKLIKVTRHCCRQTNDLYLIVKKTFSF